MKKFFIFFITFFIYQQGIAAEDYYTFNSQNDKQRFASLTAQLRCLVCQNQTLAESNAPLATDLRDQIYQRINAGQSDKTITDYLVSRYGNFILYQPPFDKATLVLWLAPFVMLFVGVFWLVCGIHLVRKKPPPPAL